MNRLCVHGVVKNGQVVLEVPLELPDGTVVTVTDSEPDDVASIGPQGPPLVAELMDPIAGMWAHRSEMADAEQWVRRLRGGRE